ncbi:MAG: class I SAM-dependent methyltransferase [Natronosporangium sp.]
MGRGRLCARQCRIFPYARSPPAQPGGLAADLAAYYDQEAAARAARELDPERVARRAEFLALLRAERRRMVLEVGTGPGRDATAFIAAGLAVGGVDRSREHVRLARLAGVDAYQASVLAMPFPARRFDAGWTMSTLVHVPDDQFAAAGSRSTDWEYQWAMIRVRPRRPGGTAR